MMNCKSCRGRVVIDRAYSDDRRIELGCIRCGKDWIIKDLTNPFFRFLVRKEFGLESKVNGR